jgi:hypothetical protein
MPGLTYPSAMSPLPRRIAGALLLVVLLLSGPWAATRLPAAAQDGPAIIPILASSELAAGPNRFLFSLTDRQGAPLAAPDVSVHLRFYADDVDPEAVAFESGSRFLWAIEGVRGLYAADITFPSAGRWGTRFDTTFPDGRQETVRADYDVWETTSTPSIGAPAPAVETPTADDVAGDLARLSTDPSPEPRFYEHSIAEAVTAGEPAVIAFLTPSFCQSGTCGPTIAAVKEVAAAHPELTVVHVEPYVMHEKDGYLQPLLSEEGWLQAAPWTEAWGLRTEPFVAVVDGDGLVRAKFEGAVLAEEIDAALAGL